MTADKEDFYKELLDRREDELMSAYRLIGELASANARLGGVFNGLAMSNATTTAPAKRYKKAIQDALSELMSSDTLRYSPPVETAIGILTNALKDPND